MLFVWVCLLLLCIYVHSLGFPDYARTTVSLTRALRTTQSSVAFRRTEGSQYNALLVITKPSSSAFSSLSSSLSSSSSLSPDDNSAMLFLKKIGKVGGSANRDFRCAFGVDEGPSGKSMGNQGPLKKSPAAFPSCIATGIIDDLREAFPSTTCGTMWSGFTDQVMGGVSKAHLVREMFHGRVANVLRGRVSLLNNGGFIQMATNLNNNLINNIHKNNNDDDSTLRLESRRLNSVDASIFDGVEVDVACHSSESDEAGNRFPLQSFNVHLKTFACLRPFSSYRATFSVPTSGVWTTIRIPFSKFRGHGPGASDHSLDASQLVRAAIVAIGRAMEVELAMAGLRFYRNEI